VYLRRARTFAGAVGALAVLGGATAGTAWAVDPLPPSSKTFNVPLSGAEQTASGIPGDPDGSGSATITMNKGTHQVCSTVSWSNIAQPVVAGHIHQGSSGQPENPAWTINLFGPNIGGTPSGVTSCQIAPGPMLTAMMRHPQFFNVVVHNQAFPAGAIRGRLGSGALICQIDPTLCPVP
jgi:hypothetical protein